MNPRQPAPTPPRRHQALWICLLLAAVTLAVYWPVTGYEFVNYDDTDFIAYNPVIQAGITATGLHYALSAEVARNWHPLTVISHMLDCQLFGPRAGWHHLTSVLFHIANSILLFLLLRRMTAAFWRSALVAALFAWHPLHVESVAWVAERKDVLSAFFWWLTLWAWLGWASASKNPGSKSKLLYILSIILFACAAMSKPMVVTFPFVLLLLDYWPLGRFKLRAPPPPIKQATAKSRPSPPSVKSAKVSVPIWRLLVEKIPFFAIIVALCWKTFLVQKAGGAVMDTANFSFASRLSNVFVSYVRYPAMMFWPVNLTALNMRFGGWQTWQVAGAVILLAAFTVWIVIQARKRPWLATGWFWYLGMLVPVIGLVQVGMQSLADRYTYLPMIGLFIILVWGCAELAVRFHLPKYVPVLAAALSLAACLLVTAHQIPCWRNSETLFYKMLAVNDKNYIAHYNLGNLYNRRGQFDLAATNYIQALAAEPNFADVHNNFADLLLNHQQYDGAILHYQEAARIKPSATAFYNLGNTYAAAANSRHDTNRFALAVQAYQQSLQLNPNYADAHNNFATLLLNLQQLDLAAAHYQTAINLNPARPESHNGLGICYASQGKMEEAAVQFRQAIALAPRDPGLYDSLGKSLGSEGKYDEAIAAFAKALQLNPADCEAEFNIGLSYLHLNRRDEARTHFLAALRLQPNYTPARQALSELDQPPK